MAGKSKGDHKPSSGNRKLVRRKRALQRVEKKISRWKRYQSEEKPCVTASQKESKGFSPRSRHKGWDTSGLEKEKSFIEGL